jgi:hypothetical protein
VDCWAGGPGVQSGPPQIIEDLPQRGGGGAGDSGQFVQGECLQVLGDGGCGFGVGGVAVVAGGEDAGAFLRLVARQADRGVVQLVGFGQ